MIMHQTRWQRFKAWVRWRLAGRPERVTYTMDHGATRMDDGEVEILGSSPRPGVRLSDAMTKRLEK